MVRHTEKVEIDLLHETLLFLGMYSTYTSKATVWRQHLCHSYLAKFGLLGPRTRFVIVHGDDGVPRNEVSSFIMAKSMSDSCICRAAAAAPAAVRGFFVLSVS